MTRLDTLAQPGVVLYLKALLTVALALGLSLSAAAAEAATPTEGTASSCIAEVQGTDFLAVQEYVILDSLGEVPVTTAVPEGPRRLADFYAAVGGSAPTGILPEDQVEAQVVACAGRWLMFRTYTTYVRRGAVVCLDAHPGALHYAPPTPAVPGGSGIVPQPLSHGVTLVAGSARIFCGVRSLGRSLSVRAADIDAFALRVHAPNALAALAIIAPPAP